MNNEKNPLWTRRNGEGSKAFEAFTIYRDLGPNRSYNKVLKELNGKKSYIRQIHRWARTYQWKFRVRMYEDHLDGIKLEFHQKELEKIHKELLSHSDEILQKLIDLTNGTLHPSQGNVYGIELYFKLIGLIHPNRVR